MQSDREEFASLRVRLDGARAASGRSSGLDFVESHVFDPADFVIRADGVCRSTQKWREWWWLLLPETIYRFLAGWLRLNTFNGRCGY
jgi:hypothetical protein